MAVENRAGMVPADMETSYYKYWKPEFYHLLKVLEFGGKKHGDDNWLHAKGAKSSLSQMHDSMFHHLAESYGRVANFDPLNCKDAESGQDALLHLACRALMCYTRLQRGLL